MQVPKDGLTRPGVYFFQFMAEAANIRPDTVAAINDAFDKAVQILQASRHCAHRLKPGTNQHTAVITDEGGVYTQRCHTRKVGARGLPIRARGGSPVHTCLSPVMAAATTLYKAAVA